MASILFHDLMNNPIFLVTIEPLMLLSLLAFTPPNSPIRPGCLPIFILLLVHSISINRKTATRNFHREMLTAFKAGVFLRYIDVALISRWAYSHGGPTSARGGESNIRHDPVKESRQVSLLSKLSWAATTTFGNRMPGTPWAVKTIPNFSTRDPSWVPGRRRFIATRMLQAMALYVALDIITHAEVDPKTNARNFSARKVAFFSRLDEVDAEEIATRIVVSLITWLVGYLILQSIFCALSGVTVALGLYEPGDWPPLFGSVAECHSVRNFWGRFWQQSMRTRIAHPAHLMTYSILRLKKGSIVARYTFILLTFAVSGLLHGANDIGVGFEWRESGAMNFFCIQTLGIAIEDGVQEVFKKSVGHNRAASSWVRFVGHVWVLLWLSWTTPEWVYPKLRHSTGSEADLIVPFSFVQLKK